jgi:hypothetical protein
MKPQPVPCPLCGAPPDRDTGRSDDGFFYVMCATRDAGCPKDSAWGKDQDEAILAWNRDVMATSCRLGKKFLEEKAPGGTAHFHAPGTTLTIHVNGMALETAPLPAGGVLPRGPDTDDLYRAEARVVAALKQAAAVGARVRDWSAKEGDADFYDRAVPAALLQVLDSFAPTAAVPAAVAYLQMLGLAVTVVPGAGPDAAEGGG